MNISNARAFGQSCFCLPKESLNRLKETLEKVFWAVCGFFNFYVDFFTQGLADFFGLETLRHGTSWDNYLEIRLHGPDPTHGGSDRGATVGHKAAKTGPAESQDIYINHSKGKFFAFLDSQAGKTTSYLDKEGIEQTIVMSKVHFLFYQVHIRIAPHTYGFGAGAATAAPQEATGKAILVWRFFCGIVSFFAPTVKLRFRPEDVMQTFQNDYLLPGKAVFTTKPITTDHLGLTGIFKQACDGNIGKRMRKDPLKTLWGAARVINPVGLGLLAAFGIYYLSHRNHSHSIQSVAVLNG